MALVAPIEVILIVLALTVMADEVSPQKTREQIPEIAHHFPFFGLRPMGW